MEAPSTPALIRCAELTSADLTITRVGANSIFSFDQDGRNVSVESGAILLRVPAGSGGARIRNGSALTVGIAGTTVMFRIATAQLQQAHRSRRKRSGLANETSGKENCGARWPDAHRQDRVRRICLKPVDIDESLILRTAILITEFRTAAQSRSHAQRS